MRLPLPTYVLVGKKRYRIVKLKPNGDFVGDCNTDLKRIRVDTSDIEESKGTLLHEILHAIWYEYEIKERTTEESTVMKLEKGLIQVIKDNPCVLIYINQSV